MIFCSKYQKKVEINSNIIIAKAKRHELNYCIADQKMNENQKLVVTFFALVCY